jgi:hypothetical protein
MIRSADLTDLFLNSAARRPRMKGRGWPGMEFSTLSCDFSHRSRPCGLARIEDLGALTLDKSDLEDIAKCQPGECGLKLSGRELAVSLSAKSSPCRAKFPA